jgi:hypothetical protein
LVATTGDCTRQIATLINGGHLDRLLVAGILITLFAIGFIGIRRSLLATLRRRAFLGEFLTLFGRYVQSGAQDEAIYVELTHRLVRMQREIGAHGMMAMFRPPFASVAYKNYPILINMLPEYRRSANDWALHGQALEYASAIRDALLRYSGSIDELEEDDRTEIKNPVAWFREGMRDLVALPFTILQSLGILSSATTSGIARSAIIRTGSGLLALVTLIAGLVQILAGWDTTIGFVHHLFGH